MSLDVERYSLLPTETEADRHEFFIEMLLSGLDSCEGQVQLPASELREATGHFRDAGYQNAWTHTRKRLGRHGVTAELACLLTMTQFTLELIVEEREEVVYREQILETQPDELIFSHRFKDVVAEGDQLIVTSRTSELLVSVPIPDRA